jgi:hypothetical protein
MNIQYTNGYPELVLIGNCDIGFFYLTADWLQNNLNINFSNKDQHGQVIFWQFEFAGSVLLLKHDANSHLCIQPTASTKFTDVDKSAILNFEEVLIHM